MAASPFSRVLTPGPVRFCEEARAYRQGSAESTEDTHAAGRQLRGKLLTMFLTGRCLEMKTDLMEGSLLLPDLGCVLFSISCQAEQEKQTIADELEHGNGKHRRQWANSEVGLNLIPGNAALLQSPGERGTYVQRVLKTNTVFKFRGLRCEARHVCELCDLGSVYSAPRRLSHQLQGSGYYLANWWWWGFLGRLPCIQEQRPTATGLDQEGSMQVMRRYS